LETLKVDVEPLASKLLNNRTAHSHYLRHTQEQAVILKKVVEKGKSQNALNNSLDHVCKVKPSISASGSQPSGNTKKDKIYRPPSSTQKNKVEAHPRTVKSSLKNKNCVVKPKGTAFMQHSKLNANSELICVKCNGYLVHGLPRLKFEKDYLCSACQLGKSKKHTHKPKAENTNLEVLNTLHMDLYGPLRVQTISLEKSNKNVNGLHPTSQSQFSISNRLNGIIGLAGSKDRQPMLTPGTYIQWKSRIKRYIDTKPNRELIHYCLENPLYKLGWNNKPVLDSEGNPTTVTERVFETYKNVEPEIRDQLNAEAEAVQIILTGIDNDTMSKILNPISFGNLESSHHWMENRLNHTI
nr:retrovirus-related Pol polyprotein from transposon TNT 1-94 [Tanacetum cinerariifolium]